MTVLFWFLVLASAGEDFATRADRLKVFYSRRTWPRTGRA